MSWWAWAVLSVGLGALFVLDFLFFGRAGQPISTAKAARWSIAWLVVGTAFALFVWAVDGPDLSGQYLGGYLLERILSVDNLAVLFIVLGGANVPAEAEIRALSWGLVGALGLRAILIVAGVALLTVIPGLAAVLGAILIFTGFRLFRQERLVTHHGPGRLQRWTAAVLPSVPDYEGRALWVRRDGHRRVTPLIPVIAAVMAADVVFALDSVPAVLSFTRVTWVVLAANSFALLGLRPLYFLVSGLIERLRYLKHGLGVILAVAGISLILDEFHPLPTWVELVSVMVILAIAVGASLFPVRPLASPAGKGPE
ncbi:MAG: tellurite resistance protein TerC [Acidimicrobiaceae bacterium]|nr:tellurite resistance protein TerC [Acidimicrobiaceae bacterium]